MGENENHAGRIVLIAVIVILASLSGFFLIGSAATAVSDRDRDAYLIVEQVYFESKEIEKDTYDIEVKAYVTNDGDDPCDVRVSVFAKEMDSNLVFDSDTMFLGILEGRTTVKANMIVSIDSMRRYIIEVLVYKDGKVVVKGSGTVNLKEAGTGAKDFETDERDSAPPEANMFSGAKDVADDLPFPALGLLSVVFAAVAYFHRRWKK
jgi:hypothetical protein